MGCHTSFYNVATFPNESNWEEKLALKLEQEALNYSEDITAIKYFQRLARHVRESSCNRWKLYQYYKNIDKSVTIYKGKVYTTVEFPFVFRTYDYDLVITSLNHFKELKLHTNSWVLEEDWEKLLTKFWMLYPEGIIITG